MGNLLRIKISDFQCFTKTHPVRSKGCRAPPSRRINSFLTKLMTGNKSGAHPLTTFGLTRGAATKCLPRWRDFAPCAEGMGGRRLKRESRSPRRLMSRSGRRRLCASHHHPGSRMRLSGSSRTQRKPLKRPRITPLAFPGRRKRPHHPQRRAMTPSSRATLPCATST